MSAVVSDCMVTSDSRRALGFGRGPGEGTRVRVDRHARCGRPASRRKVSVLAGRSASVAVAVKVSSTSPVHGLVADRVQHRCHVHLVDGDIDRLGVCRRGAVVSDLTVTS